jgi:hypothetical protein
MKEKRRKLMPPLLGRRFNFEQPTIRRPGVEFKLFVFREGIWFGCFEGASYVPTAFA